MERFVSGEVFSIVTVLNPCHMSGIWTHGYLTADHKGQVDTEAKSVVEESQWIR